MKTDNYALWKLCFNDSVAFTDLYFSQKYTPQNTMSIYHGRQLVAALQMLDYSLYCAQQLIPTAYISGACTHPNFRNKGIMQELLCNTHQRMYSNGKWFSVLIPAEEWLWKFYGKANYATVFWQTERQVTICSELPDGAYTITPYSQEQEALVFEFFCKQLLQRECCMQHTIDDFRVIFADLKLVDGNIWVAKKEHVICGLVFAIVQENHIQCTELLAESAEAEKQLLHYIAGQYGRNNIHITTQAKNKKDAIPLGMARILHPLNVLKCYAHQYPQKEICIKLSGDTHIAQNNGYYSIKNGDCFFQEKPTATYQEMSVLELTAFVFAHTLPYMSLMLN